MAHPVPTSCKIVVGSVLILVRAPLVAVTRGLVMIRPRLILIAHSLIPIRPGLILMGVDPPAPGRTGPAAADFAVPQVGAARRTARDLDPLPAAWTPRNIRHPLVL